MSEFAPETKTTEAAPEAAPATIIESAAPTLADDIARAIDSEIERELHAGPEAEIDRNRKAIGEMYVSRLAQK